MNLPEKETRFLSEIALVEAFSIFLKKLGEVPRLKKGMGYSIEGTTDEDPKLITYSRALDIIREGIQFNLRTGQRCIIYISVDEPPTVAIEPIFEEYWDSCEPSQTPEIANMVRYSFSW